MQRKQNSKKLAQEDIVGKTLKYIPEDSKNPETTENLYIEGDNLEVLKLLRQNYYGAIKMIYIDPPYNTGNDFVYKDKFDMGKNKSDIDILVLMEKREDVMDEFDLEEILEPILQEYFEYNNIHFTFIYMKDYDSTFARQYIDSNDKLIVNEFKEIDFRLYVNKYLRENQWLIERIKKDTKLMEEKNGSSIL